MSRNGNNNVHWSSSFSLSLSAKKIQSPKTYIFHVLRVDSSQVSQVLCQINGKTVTTFQSHLVCHGFDGASMCRVTHFLCLSRGQSHPVAVATGTHSATPGYHLGYKKKKKNKDLEKYIYIVCSSCATLVDKKKCAHRMTKRLWICFILNKQEL